MRLSCESGLSHLLGKVSFKKFLRAGLAADRLICWAKSKGRRIWPTDEAMLINKRDEPMIGLAADVCASGSRAFDGGN